MGSTTAQPVVVLDDVKLHPNHVVLGGVRLNCGWKAKQKEITDKRRLLHSLVDFQQILTQEVFTQGQQVLYGDCPPASPPFLLWRVVLIVCCLLIQLSAWEVQVHCAV